MRWPVLALLLLRTVTAETATVVQQKLYGLSSGLAYYVEMTIGQPVYSSANAQASTANTFNMLVDTGSSNTAVVTADCCSTTNEHTYSCANSSTCVAKNTSVSVSYITGSWGGDLVADTFSSPSFGAITDVPFTEIEQQSNFIQAGYDGIIGLAFDSIASPTIDPPPSYFDFISQNRNLPDVFSLLMCGTLQPLLFKQFRSSEDLYAGELLLGGIDGPKGQVYHQGDIVYTPLVQDKWYNVLITELRVGGQSVDVDCRDINSPRAIMDTGTSNIAFPSSVYAAVVNELEAQVSAQITNIDANLFNDEVPCCSAMCDPTDPNSDLMKLPALSIALAVEASNGKQQQLRVTIPPEYLWRPVYRDSIFPGARKWCRVFGISEGDITLPGDVYMDGLFTVHDREKKQLGVAIAKSCPNAVNSTKRIFVEELPNNVDSFCKCMSTSDRNKNLLSSYFPFGGGPCFFWLWWMYVVLVSVVLILLSLGTIIWVCVRRRIRRKRMRRHMQGVGIGTPGMSRNLLSSDCGQGSDGFTPHASKASTASSVTRPSKTPADAVAITLDSP